MADEGDVLTDLNMDPAAGANGADNQPVAGIIQQYVKDLSVENPNAPACFQWQSQPEVDIQFNIAAQQIDGEVHEVELKINVTSKTKEGTIYLVELSYAALVGMRNLPDEQAHHFLYAEAPRLLFPFARRVIADATRDTGFQPMQIEPIDFNGLYMQQLQRRAEEQAAAGGDMPPAGEA
ncbi:protein-export chaperone SecB [Tsuneonella suprasediminis]|uniref:Protein-export protein SecB n=1 Tax=Tsuneonella suprasediminis TaxID=2306996 RepID=A0A419R253_9SPHN|nr:protein-export chaperone SecB [Tsuneonella suprasediminis]RJX67994.1 protein-export chaperone SecB [Tsuneonella suprasediminis]